jgi:hypothetical protein
VGRFIVRRLAQMVFVLWAVSVLTFFIFNVIPNGDPAVRMAGKNPTDTQIEAIRKEWGFDDNIFVQYFTMMKKVFTGRPRVVLHPAAGDEEIVKGFRGRCRSPSARRSCGCSWRSASALQRHARRASSRTASSRSSR